MKRLLKRWLIVLSLPLLFWGIWEFCDSQTGGFRTYELLSNMPNRSDWEAPPLSALEQKKILQVLDQPFFFLGGGGQSYAFLSQDGKVVLKFFRHDHLSPKRLLEHLPLPKILDGLRLQLMNYKSRKDISPLLESCKLAFDELQEETGLLYVHLNKTDGQFKKVTLIDKIGTRHTIDLDATEFLLQKKVELLFPELQTLMQNHRVDEAKRRIDSLIYNLRKRSEKGIGNTDGALKRNFGCCEGNTLCLDIGSFIRDASLKNPQNAHQEIVKKTERLSRWLKKYYPELYEYYQQRVDLIPRADYAFLNENAT